MQHSEVIRRVSQLCIPEAILIMHVAWKDGNSWIHLLPMYPCKMITERCVTHHAVLHTMGRDSLNLEA